MKIKIKNLAIDADKYALTVADGLNVIVDDNCLEYLDDTDDAEYDLPVEVCTSRWTNRF